jgi:hypothetical protein
MAENLIILVAIALVVGVFFLALFRVLARRERRALRKVKGANPGTRGVGALLRFRTKAARSAKCARGIAAVAARCSRQYTGKVPVGWFPRISRTRASWARESMAGRIVAEVREADHSPLCALTGATKAAHCGGKGLSRW